MSSNQAEPIAVIGTGCRFPGHANTPSRLWDLLKEPYDLVQKIPEDRFSAEGFHNENSSYHGNSNVRHSYFLDENVRQFDAQFFGIKPVEANAIDPQQRLLLETVYEALEAAGLKVSSLKGSDTAVYVGIMCGDYEAMLLRDLSTVPTYHATGIARSIVSNRISYFFDWKGPSMTIDTACSSSLIALHQAVQALRQGDSRVAVAAGTNLILGPENYISESKLKMLSPTGQSRMWDASADGYARGEGIATVVLKRLSAAIEDGDHIECIVRETATNQDGRTKGITMPSASSQASLIRHVYAKAGLDPAAEADRCQYFECHGTGTLAGDPVEAEAVRTAFFGLDDSHTPKASSKLQNQPQTIPNSVSPLYVGSVKTVIGHTEGTAGLAGVIKASLALQHGVIPPNLHFNSLNPSIEPFYGHVLRVPTATVPWPSVVSGQPRRASVNSFGFGGANAHAILESYNGNEASPAYQSDGGSDDSSIVGTPFVLSANSQRSLKATSSLYSNYLRENRSTSLHDLSWMLYSRRSVLPVRASLVATDVEGLISQLDATSEAANPGLHPIAASSSEKPQILGIFTGQGAQWAAMGRELIQHSDFAMSRLVMLDRLMMELSVQDRPSWSLVKTIMDGSDLSQAAMSQPLCTAIQILLVDLLHAAGVSFSAVVGHSSGEIAAAYAAGYVSAVDAYRIAYYRGMHASLACGPDGKQGKMMAVATSREDAQQLCELPRLAGRICVAAVNSSNSVTLAGDADAVLEAQVVFEDEQRAAKLLFVDTAYHSHHMSRPSIAYESSLSSFKPQFRPSSEAKAKWYSSVYNEEASFIPDKLNSTYWNANMTGVVRFSDAVQQACAECGPFDAAVEVGPHPALRTLALASIKESSTAKESLLYTGVLKRGKHAVETFAEALGSMWSALGDGSVDMKAYQDALTGARMRNIVTGLPRYVWDKKDEFWHESRASRKFRQRKEPTHQLLGDLLPDGTDGSEYRWRNFLSVKEIPWLDGHKLQGQTVFPAAGYVSMAFESSSMLLAGREAKLLEAEDVVIHSALVFQEDDEAVETLFTLTNVQEDGESAVSANFALHATVGKQADSMAVKASGILKVVLGRPSPDVLPAQSDPESLMVNVDSDRFYSSLADIGYGYTGPFRALDNLTRSAGSGAGTIANNVDDHEGHHFFIHPATLDTAIQAVILAYCYPNDGRLWAIHVPTRIRSIRINPALCVEHLSKLSELPFDSAQTTHDATGIYGDAEVYTPTREQALVQLEGVHCVLLAGATAADDTQLFSTTVWGHAAPDGAAVCWDGRATEEQYQLARDVERACLYYLNLWERQIPSDYQPNDSSRGLLRFSSHIRRQVSSGKHPYAKKEWMNDGDEILHSILDKYPDSLDLKMVEAVGNNIPAVLRGETTILEHLMKDDLLTKYYADALAFPSYTVYLARMVSQLTHRYPHMKILEIGAGTGHATRRILKEIGATFDSYHFTDISTGFFEAAQSDFEQHAEKMTFKALDIEKDVTTQGYQANSFDLVIASFVLHATTSLETTLHNVRALLKPGGYLLLLEMTDNDPIRPGFTFGSLPGWWAGEADGRILSPCPEPMEWDGLLRQNGFSGIDSMTDDVDRLPFPASVISSQAIDSRVKLLREPLTEISSLDHGTVGEELIIVGGSSLRTSGLIRRIKSLIGPLYTSIASRLTLDDVEPGEVTSTTTILNLSDIDKPVFAKLTERSLDGMKSAFENARTILWFTDGCRDRNPHANMSLGFGRTMVWEIPGLQLQFIDVELQNFSAETAVEALLRYELANEWSSKGQLNDMLYSIEPEMLDHKNGLKIARVKSNTTRNNNFNAARRNISETVDTSEFSVSIIYEASQLILEKGPSLQTLKAGISTANTIVMVRFSSASSVPIGNSSRLHVIYGKDETTGNNVIGFSESSASTAVVPRQWVAQLTTKDDSPHAVMATIDALVSTHLLADLSRGDVLLVHEPSAGLASALSKTAAKVGVRLFVTTAGRRLRNLERVIVLQPHMQRRALSRHLPDVIHKYVDFSTDVAGRDVAEAIANYAPRYCKHEKANNIFQTYTHVYHATGDANESVIQQQITAAAQFVLTSAVACSPSEQDVVNITDVAALNSITQRASVIDWQTTKGSIPVTVRPIDSKLRFAGDRTYWLVGLTGDLGLSLCEWMVRMGARYVALTSRNPKINARWLEKVEIMGATIKVISNDVTNMQDLRTSYREICDTLPPLAGVAQGAMVLRDTSFRDMDLETMETVLRPKVQGSINLEELFHDSDLDFFIYFSSMTGIVGNMGQSNYTAANAFMMSLSAQRRQRGLASSVINIGAVIGVGYVTREVNEAGQDNLQKGGYMWISEQAFHQIFAEAVVAGQKDSTVDESELTTGLRRIKESDDRKPIWFDNPKFSHHMIAASAVDAGAANQGGALAPLRTRLEEAASQEQVFDILKDSFLMKLQSLLKFHPGEGQSDAAVLSLRTDALGVDSLIAVEIRTWFIKSLQVNMPVLKILGGASIGEILEHAMSQMSKTLTPKQGRDSVSGEASGQPESKPQTPPMAEQSSSASLIKISASTSEDFDSDAKAITPPSSEWPSSEDQDNSEQDNTKEEEMPPITRSGPLSYGQAMFWFVHVFTDDPTTLNHSASFRLRGKLRIADLKRAVNQVAMQHESLRTCFYSDTEGTRRPIQGVMRYARLSLETHRIANESEVSERFDQLRVHVYNLERGEAMRVILLTKSPSEHILLLGCHHINVDGFSHQVFMTDLEDAYNGQVAPKPPLQYLDFTIRQKEENLNGVWSQQLAYWKDIFKSIPQPIDVLPLPDAQPRSPLLRYDFHRLRTRLSAKLSARIIQQSRSIKATPFQFYLAAFRMLLIRLAGTQDFCVGIGDASRTGYDTLSGIGPYVNLLPLRFSENSQQQTFADLVHNTRNITLAALSNSRVPFGALLDELRLERSLHHSPLFQTFLDYREGSKQKTSFGGGELEMTNFETGRTAYDVNVDIIDDPEGCMIDFMVQSSLYSHDDTRHIVDSYLMILESVSGNAMQLLSRPVIFKEENIHAAQDLGRGVLHESKWSGTLIHRVVNTATNHPDTVAVNDGYGNSFTYSQMLAQVVGVAANLSRPGDSQKPYRVAVFQQRSSGWICSLLAAMYVGAAYVPVDPSLPSGRIASILQDCQPTAILADDSTVDRISTLGEISTRIINVSDILPSAAIAPQIGATPSAPGAIFYTSGSTGTPKGIIIRHSSLRNEVECSAVTYGFGVERVLQQSSMGFDMSITQIFAALCFGGYVYVCPSRTYGDPITLTQLMETEKITLTGGTPSEYLSWINSGFEYLKKSPWKYAISGGEAMSDGLMRGFRLLKKNGLRLFNAYGPTEITCSSNRKEVVYDLDVLPAACGLSPAPNTSTYIVDKAAQPLPVGFVGEIAVGGAGVALAYLNRDDETNLRFLHDKYVSSEHLERGWTSIYLTGDRGRLLPDGSLLVYGRIAGDTQVKLSGIRIDLSDIEHAILQAAEGQLSDAIVTVRRAGDDISEFLLAHVIFSTEIPFSQRQDCLDKLMANLPLARNMKPAAILMVGELPRGSSGKVDRRAVAALPLPPSAATQSNRSAISLTTEEMSLKQVWSAVVPHELLTQRDVNQDTDFFHVGGTSLLLVDLQNFIWSEFGVRLELVSMFQSSTLGRMASLLKKEMSGTEDAPLDWEAETRPPSPSSVAVLENHQRCKPGAAPKVVVLTGATGYLGNGILEQLLENDAVQIVHCVAVRRPDSLPRSSKLQIYLGNLSSPSLGLGKDQAESIFSEADVIIHNGANVSHLQHYRSLKAENMLATKELVLLSLPRGIPIHYVSTAGIALYAGGSQFREVSGALYPPPPDGLDGYTASKWASERLLERTNEKFGLPVTIHRPSNISRQDIPQLDLFQNLLKYSSLAGAVPSSSKLRGFLNLVPLQDCASDILQKALDPAHASTGSVRFYHCIGDVNVDLASLKSFVSQGGEKEVEVMSPEAWASRGEQLGLHSTVASVFRQVDQGDPIVFPRLVRYDAEMGSL